MALKNANDGSVLEMLSYLDEVIPGNALKPGNGCNTWAIYITCKRLATMDASDIRTYCLADEFASAEADVWHELP